ncbi:hypothetical protein BBO99_00001406 [Phytophthora kernoviae]|uniref:Uncharacterized protein n=2 Tax=Phytophthora kernoviae TaxID=325452 RepID=A0A3R7HMP2_9STRA|nr:hypothetical protein G195_002176 [Phytophthora kernoviae 00238/432]KAG2530592.1 hypothetical protein JM16_000894 [Phytophthora kernoviae]KAG2531320.1 hypothetical protein JM18_001673 [Phytophthora kernoviae]RLN26179.1 hypothetical protein BBI17_001275 [Phytophthora kernoviae]RLN84361.1 hypothetical protein BBO99_00001406 [Phytophthora kernoviae]
MSLKHLKPIDIKRNPSLQDGYQLFPIADKWAELLPERVPLQFSLFRYLGFYVASTKNGKSTVVKSRAVSALRVTIQNEDKVVFNERVGVAFPNGVYYVQDIRLENAGVHTVCVTVEGGLADDLAPLVLKTQVFEFMKLHECPDLERGAYQPLREFVLNSIKKGEREKLRDDAFLEKYVRTKKHSLRNMDARWWLRTFVEHTLDREERQKLLQISAVKNSCRTTHKRKQEHPSRTADKKEHDNLFERRRRDWKRVRAGDVRMFALEPLHAGATITVYSSKEMYRQLSLYAQI